MADHGTLELDFSRPADDSSLGALLADLAGTRPRWAGHDKRSRRAGRRMTVAANLHRLRAELESEYAELAAY